MFLLKKVMIWSCPNFARVRTGQLSRQAQICYLPNISIMYWYDTKIWLNISWRATSWFRQKVHWDICSMILLTKTPCHYDHGTYKSMKLERLNAVLAWIMAWCRLRFKPLSKLSSRCLFWSVLSWIITDIFCQVPVKQPCYVWMIKLRESIPDWYKDHLCMRPANERRRYIVTSSLVGWAHTQTDPCW